MPLDPGPARFLRALTILVAVGLLAIACMLAGCSEAHYYSDGLPDHELHLNDDLGGELQRQLCGRTVTRIVATPRDTLTFVYDDGSTLRLRAGTDDNLHVKLKMNSTPLRPQAQPTPTFHSYPGVFDEFEERDPETDFQIVDTCPYCGEDVPEPWAPCCEESARCNRRDDPFRNLTVEEVEATHDFGDDDFILGGG